MKQRFLSRPEAAQYLTERGVRRTKNTLQKYATTGGGPAYQLLGNRALYTEKNLDAWIETEISPPRSSTSEEVAA